MTRDHRKLGVFVLADELVIEVFRLTQLMPHEERFGLQAQLRRAAISSVVDIVEGCARRTWRDDVHFLAMALGAASRTQYLLDLASRLDMLPEPDATDLSERYRELSRGLRILIDSLSNQEPRHET